MKTPEEYLTEHIFAREGLAEDEYTPEEKIFLQKYLGMEVDISEKPAPKEHESSTPATGEVAYSDPVPEPDAPREKQDNTPSYHPEIMGERAQFPEEKPELPLRESREETLKQAESIQFVGFTVFDQEYAMPISEVQEVIRYMEPTRIPTAPSYVSGMINLRGRVTPLVFLERLLDVRKNGGGGHNFIVVCNAGGLQIGLIIHSISTMYKVKQDQIDWNIESKLGVSSEYLTGLFKEEDRIIGIVAIDRLADRILKE